MKKKLRIPSSLSLVLLITGSLLLLSYGNTRNHPTINGFIVEAFVGRYSKGDVNAPRFRNYEFRLDKVKLKGDYITKPGLFNPSEIDRFHEDVGNYLYSNAIFTEEPREETPKKWIEHGGFSADVPEVPASLRHFYDPTQPPGKRYLNDLANSRLMSWFQKKFTNPETDGVEWALGSKGSFGVTEHSYTWENGKKFLKGALEEANPDKRNNFMARAWRSLGETLHMIADNGCPPHVRNDAHPSVPFSMVSYFGNPDPYEELLDEWQNADVNALNTYKSGSVPPDEIKKFRQAKTTREIAHDLALFTNQNFFTNETISGTDWKGNEVKPVINPHYIYPLPKLQHATYEKNYYRKDIAGQEVLMCTDTWFFRKYPIKKTYPYMDEASVKSQAKVLIPTITEAGVNVVKLFIPELKVVINSLSDDGTISGSVVHTPDSEYKEKINYNGPVVVRSASFTELARLNAVNGRFTGSIGTNQEQEVFAEIEFGGVIVKSDKLRKQAAPKPAAPVGNKMKVAVRVTLNVSYSDGYKDNNQTFPQSGWHFWESWGDWREFTLPRNNSFRGVRQDGDPQSTVAGEMTDDKIVWMDVTYHDVGKAGSTMINEEWWKMELRNIPLESGNEYGKSFVIEGWDVINERPNPEFVKALKKLEHKIVFYPDKKEINLVNINYHTTEVKSIRDLSGPYMGIMKNRPVINVRVSYNVY